MLWHLTVHNHIRLTDDRLFFLDVRHVEGVDITCSNSDVEEAVQRFQSFITGSSNSAHEFCFDVQHYALIVDALPKELGENSQHEWFSRLFI